ncbi:hypothetical protein KEM55_001364, partial [Ascosphaera atra]
MPPRRGGRTGLNLGLDREIYQIVRKYVEEQQNAGVSLRLTTPVIYDYIKRSNSSLGRRTKKVLEDSIDRVLDVVKPDLENEESDSVEGDFEGLEETTVVVP